MAYNFQDIDPETMDLQKQTEEERKKRLAMLANLASGGTMGDAASLALTNRMNQATDKIGQVGELIQNPEDEMRKRMGVQPAMPVQPQQVEQPQQVPQQVAQPISQVPVNPAEIQLPQPGPGVQVAGSAQMPPAKPISPDINQSQAEANRLMQQNVSAQGTPTQSAEVTPAQLDVTYHTSFVNAANSTDPKERQSAFAQLVADKSVPEGIRTQATQSIVQDYQNEKAKRDAIRQLEQATPNDLARYMQEKNKDEGSYLKAILFKRLGLTELAEQEQEKISPQLKAESIVTDGGRFTGYRNKRGEVVKAFNSEGQLASQEELSKLNAAAMPTKAHLLPSAHGGLVQRTNPDSGQVETGVLFQDPQRGNRTYVKVGDKEYDTTGWTSMAQNVQAISAAAGAKVTGEAGAKGFDVTQPGITNNVASLASSLGAKVIGGTRTPETQAALYQQSVDAGTPGILPNGNPVAKPGTSKHEKGNAVDIDSATLTPDQRRALAMNGFRQPLPKTDPNHWEYDPSTANKKSPLFLQEQQARINEARIKEEEKHVAEAKGKEGAATIKKQAFADNAYPIVKELGNIIKESTGSGIGAGVDDLAAMIGKSPKGAQAIAKLETFASPLVSMVPRFEGSQSDRDVQMYQKQAGDFANPKLPIATRLAALQGMVKLLQIYDKEGANDWGAISGHQEKTINGVTYVFDGKGWKKK